jgi:Polyketide cyclase / dehydrase and lipid transport
MALQVVEHELTTTASPATVYALLLDGSTWPEWSPIGSFELIAPGDGSPEGVGAVRVFHTGRIHSKERVVIAQPNQAFAYELLSGLAVRDYRAVVTLRSTDGGTLIHWRSTFKAKIPGTGWIYQRQLSAFIGRTVNGLAAWASVAEFRAS